ncbi:MAG: alpha/beta hydrolase [Candidatus Riflebacteria bacterium]|nr:alpha/beta hydrolase [Candidatus Riflebacteria bacterium]
MIISPPKWKDPALKIPDGAEAFSTVNPNGHKIPAWFYKGEDKRGTIILCHGHGAESREFAPLIPVLLKMKIGILLCDFRAHGKAGGWFTPIGKYEWIDLKSVIDKAVQNGFLKTGEPIVAYGRSMGAALLANGSSKLPEINGFILESCFAELRIAATRDAKRLFNLSDSFIIDLVFIISQLVTGYEYYSNKPIESVVGIASRPLLLIHDGKDPRATDQDFERFRKKMPAAEILIVPEANHVQSFSVAPLEFEAKLRGILSMSGLNPAKPQSL